VPLIMHAGRIIAVADLWLDRSYRLRGCPGGRPGFRRTRRWRRTEAKYDEYD
jgi:hypothetical protein